MCAANDVAAIEAAHPKITVTGGTIRSFEQQFYFNCAQLMSDPEGSLTGTEPPPDGGTDAGSSFDLGAASLSFSQIQKDMDEFGCPTCHQTMSGPGQLHLVLKPWTAELVRQNYLAVLPFTQPDPLMPLVGGRFVNQVPMAPAVRARWLKWVEAGTPE
jgi:hypothetical protein